MSVQFQDRITCSVQDACTYTGLGKSTINALIADGTLQSTLVGSRRLIWVASLIALVTPTKTIEEGPQRAPPKRDSAARLDRERSRIAAKRKDTEYLRKERARNKARMRERRGRCNGAP